MPQVTEQAGVTSVTQGENGPVVNQQPGFMRVAPERPTEEVKDAGGDQKQADPAPGGKQTPDANGKDAGQGAKSGAQDQGGKGDSKAGSEGADKKNSAATTADSKPSAFEAARTDLAQDFLDNGGKLSDEAVQKAAEAFKEMGFSEQDIRIYEAGLNAQLAKTYEGFGGFDNFKQFVAWAESGMEKADQDLYNEFLDRGQFAKAGALASTYKDRWKASSGTTERRDITQKAPAANTVPGAAQPYASQAEMKKDMGDPRYGKDPAFRAMVAARMAAGG